MAGQKSNGNGQNAVCSVSQMARMVGLSRASLYAYIKRGVFLAPLYSLATKRPFYTAEMQTENVAARNSGIGVNGQYVLWYEKAQPDGACIPARQAAGRNRYAGLIDGLKALGLEKLTQTQIAEGIAAAFPDGIDGMDEEVVLRVLNRHFRRKGDV